ncbi:MAG: response regulator [Bacteriovorax sp.]|nr:response regulator [Rhizobacter sp.]
MRKIYPDVENCRALIIDSNPTLRSLQALMLRDMGVVHIVQTSRVADARRSLENRVFDIVLCDYHFEKGSVTGRDLLDDLRRAQLLPYSTVFIMVTGEASYAMVAEAAESALDSYLLKPHTALALEHRLIEARHRKTVLRTIFEAIEENDFAAAAELCRARFETRGEYWLYAARIGAELFIRLGEHDDARLLFEAVQSAKAVPWARLGLARVQAETSQLSQAVLTLESLISDQPSYADAHDVMGRVQVEQGNMEAALETYRNASELTPHSLARLQKQGMLAHYMGHAEEATKALERSVRIGLTSKSFDFQTLVLLALTHFDAHDKKAFMRNHDHLLHALERQPDSVRIQRFVNMSEVFKALIERQVATCVDQVRKFTNCIAAADFDFEAASNLLALLTRLHNSEIRLEENDAWITKIAERFCVSKGSTDMLCLAARGHAAGVELIRAGHAHIGHLSEQSMSHSIKGSHAEAVKSLLARGSETLNAKLFELAGLVLNRHGKTIDSSAGMSERLAALRKEFCSKGTQVALGGGTSRAAGALSIRS